MSDSRFALLKSIIEAPSPVGLEGAMTFGVIEPAMRKVAAGDWTFRRFLGSASLVVSTPARQPNGLSIMVVGHADKIRMQVRHIDKASGKIYIDSDSFLPLTLLGNDVSVYSESVEPGQEGFARVRGTVEALGAIHFGDAKHRSGDKGVSPEQLYLDIGQHGPNAAAQIKALGIKPGDSVLLDRPVRRTVADDSFSGAYLDNGIGSFVVTELARVLGSAGTLDHVQMHFAIASHEEIGRFGSRILASIFKPDVLIAIDVNHDYANAPGVAGKRFSPIAMGEGFTISVGSVASRKVNELLQRAAVANKIPYQLDVVGRDTGTDAMAAVLGAVDCAVASLGVPTRNMHTASEGACTRDVDACLFGLAEFVKLVEAAKLTADDFMHSHADLSLAKEVFKLPEVKAPDVKAS